jgi:Ankyrin repeats (3 copies)/Ankyrin repeat
MLQMARSQVRTPTRHDSDLDCHRTSKSMGRVATHYNVQPSSLSTWEERKGKTALHLCAERGNARIIQFLLQCGAEVDALDSRGRTALHYAARNSDAEIVVKLLESGADTEIIDCEGLSPLHAAADVGCEEVIRLLTLEGVDLNAGIGIEKSMVDDVVLS